MIWNNDCILWFAMANGEKYYVGKNFKFIKITNNTTLQEIENNAKLYNGKTHKWLFVVINNKTKKIFGQETQETHCVSLSKYFKRNNIINGKLIFCTVTPSTANGFTANLKPSIGEAGQSVKISNTKFNPIMFEIEMVEHDVETLSYMIEGDQVRNLENGTFTVYNDNHEIYKQYQTYTVKTRLGKPLYDIKIGKDSIDTSQNYNNIIENEE